MFGSKRDVADMAMAVVGVMLMFLKGIMINLYALFFHSITLIGYFQIPDHPWL